MKISVIVPEYNEEANVIPLYKKVCDALKNYDFELILVDDGSKDKTFNIIEGIAKTDKRMVGIKLRKNSGQTAALSAGINNAKGDIIVTLDGDLQNDPYDIPILINKIRNEGYDAVSGWRADRKDPFFKRIHSKFANYLRRRLIRDNVHDAGCALKAYKKEALEGIDLYGEMHRYVHALVALRGFKVGEVRVRHHPRLRGKTKYNYKRLIKGFLDLLYVKFWSDYSTRPLHFFGTLGLIQYVLSVLILIEQIVKALIIKKLLLGPLLLLAVLFVVTGTLFIIFGFLSEILIRTYYSSKNKKPYEIEKIV
ncbi:glycosyltransferase family 2 protein [Candidatus Woesearchaeota archaeon]|nr:glycosyltransferase family 2 protein [Candidatus Woesearchaeota archaeon]